MATKEMRAVYAETLVELAAADPRIVVLEADLMRATGTGIFRAAYPDRCFNAGVAEADMVGIAAGLSAEGKVPFAASFGCFASRRVFDQFFISCAYARLTVKLVGTEPGITAAYNGGTHMPFEDLGLMRMVPGLDIVEPSDPVSLAALVRALAARPGCAYLRLHRRAIEPRYPAGGGFRGRERQAAPRGTAPRHRRPRRLHGRRGAEGRRPPRGEGRRGLRDRRALAEAPRRPGSFSRRHGGPASSSPPRTTRLQAASARPSPSCSPNPVGRSSAGSGSGTSSERSGPRPGSPADSSCAPRTSRNPPWH